MDLLRKNLIRKNLIRTAAAQPALRQPLLALLTKTAETDDLNKVVPMARELPNSARGVVYHALGAKMPDLLKAVLELIEHCYAVAVGIGVDRDIKTKMPTLTPLVVTRDRWGDIEWASKQIVKEAEDLVVALRPPLKKGSLVGGLINVLQAVRDLLQEYLRYTNDQIRGLIYGIDLLRLYERYPAGSW